jgi:uncharacterized alpha/beta hydrolase family protein
MASTVTKIVKQFDIKNIRPYESWVTTSFSSMKQKKYNVSLFKSVKNACEEFMNEYKINNPNTFGYGMGIYVRYAVSKLKEDE